MSMGADSWSSAAMPVGACDCHTHVIGPANRFPMLDDRHYTPGPAPVTELRAHLQRLGLTRVVVVQPSVYGTDNRCLLSALDELDGVARGIAVMGGDVSSAQLRDWHACGVRGIRINLESLGLKEPELARQELVRSCACIAEHGWHVQVYAAYPVIEALAPTLMDLPCPVVLDHFAMAAFSSSALAVVLDLLDSGRVYLKLSAPYRLPGSQDAALWATELVRRVPFALLWGSDWPHTARMPGAGALEVSPYRAIDPQTLLADLFHWLPTSALREQVLSLNPTTLYGF